LSLTAFRSVLFHYLYVYRFPSSCEFRDNDEDAKKYAFYDKFAVMMELGRDAPVFMR